jgi:hypothetical protein
MDQTPREIEEHIERTRERLGSHLVELEQKVEAATDWREHFRTRPHVFLGAALVGGATLAFVLHARHPRTVSDDAEIRRFADDPSSARAQVMELWSNLKGALIGVASARLKGYLGEFMPGFDEHYRRAEQRSETHHSARSIGR